MEEHWKCLFCLEIKLLQRSPILSLAFWEWDEDYFLVGLHTKLNLNKWKIIAVIFATLAVAKIKPENFFWLEQDLNPWPLRYRCSALPIEPSSQLGAGHSVSSIYTRLGDEMTVYIELTERPAPSWLDSSIGRVLHRYRRGHGFESRSSQKKFFRLNFRNCLSCV